MHVTLKAGVIVLSSMMLFKCLFRPSISLLISYVHQHDSLGYLIAFVDLVPVATEKVRQSYPVENFLESVEEYSEGKIHKSEPEPGNGNVNTLYFVNQDRGNT